MKVQGKGTLKGFFVSVRLHPRSSREMLYRGVGGALEAWVNAPPVEGEANKALRKLVAGTFGVALGKVSLVAGEKSREKRLLLEGLMKEAAEAVIAKLPIKNK